MLLLLLSVRLSLLTTYSTSCYRGCRICRRRRHHLQYPLTPPLHCCCHSVIHSFVKQLTTTTTTKKSNTTHFVVDILNCWLSLARSVCHSVCRNRSFAKQIDSERVLEQCRKPPHVRTMIHTENVRVQSCVFVYDYCTPYDDNERTTSTMNTNTTTQQR